MKKELPAISKHLLFLAVFLYIGFGLVSAVTINVPGDYSEVNSAIGNASDGDVINVTGVFTEDLFIDKEITIIGQRRETSIDGEHTVISDDVIIKDLNISTTGTAILLDSQFSGLNNIEIDNIYFDLTNDPSIGVYVGGGISNTGVSNIVMTDNVFEGPDNKVCNPWKIGGDFINGGISVPIDDLDFLRNTVYNCSIPINIQNENINDILMDSNTFRGTDGVLYLWAQGGSGPTGVFSRFVFTNNDIDGTNSYGLGFDGEAVGGPNFVDANFGTGNKVNYNDFVGIPGAYGFGAVSFLPNVVNYSLNATYNYWGACDGPSGIANGSGTEVNGSIVVDPFIGLCLSNKVNVSCAFEEKNVTLSADVNGTGVETVIFSYTIDGVNKNVTGSLTPGSLNNYEYMIPGGEIPNGDISWNVYADDLFDNTFMDGLKSFYARNVTDLSIGPSSPDGLNDWYLVEPVFILVADFAANNVYYRWDSIIDVLYTVPFDLAGIPNGAISGGILELNYYSEFDCEDGNPGNETNQNLVFKVDLVNPSLEDLMPVDGSIVYNNPRPEISVLLDEVYSGNSGINANSVYMRIDGNLSNASVSFVNASAVDVIVSHIPTENLTEGVHTVMVYAEDFAGRFNSTSWSFEINTTKPGVDLTINMPENASYNTRRIPFNLTTTDEVDLIEYINYNDRRPRWRTLCRNCDNYGYDRLRRKNLNEGENNLSFMATADFGIESVNIELFIDSRRPRISKILPKRNAITNGSGFFIKFVEANVQEVSVSFNPTESLNLSSCVPSGRSATECSVNLNLTGFDTQEIAYSFNVSDSVNTVMSREFTVRVDISSPELTVNMPENFTYGRRVPFNISVTEDVLLEYYDNLDNNPRWRRICNNCDAYGTGRSRTKSFKRGEHQLQVRAVDKAGNSDVEIIDFNVIF